MTHPILPSIHGRTAFDAFELMDVTGSGISQRLLEHSVARRHVREGADDENPRCTQRRPALRDIIARAETDAGSDEAYFLAQLRAVVAAFETPADRLLARYRDWPSGPAQFYGERRDWDDPLDRTAGISGPAQRERQSLGSSATGCATAKLGSK